MSVQGVSIAFGQDALAATPTYTRLDSSTMISNGLRINAWRTHRGRSYFTDKTQTGTATVDFTDSGGILDPTHAAGPFYPMDPNCPFAIALYNPVAATWTTVFAGMQQQVPQTLDVSARFSRGSIEAVDLMALLATAEIPPGVDFDSSGTGAHTPNTIGDTTYAGQTVQDRIKAILADVGIPSGMTDIFTGNVNVQGSVYPPGTNALEAMWDAADAEFPGLANIYVSKGTSAGPGKVTFHGRLARFNPTDPTYNINTWHVGDHPAVASHSSWALISGLSFDRDVNKVIDASLFSPDNIADADIPGQLAASGSAITKFGNRTYSGTNLITAGGVSDGLNANEETKLYSNYFVDNFKDAQTRITQLTVTNVRQGAPNEAAQWLFLTGVEISDLIYVTTTHPGGGGFSLEPYFVEGITYDVRPGNAYAPLVTMTLDLSPQAYFASGWPPPNP